MSSSAAARHHIVILGTGLTALTLARSLLLVTPPLPIYLTLVDKAKNPGGRLTTRYYDSGVVLETGARVFESPTGSPEFVKEVEGWERKGWVREVEQSRRKGVMGNGKWWEGVGGLTKGLVDGLLSEINAAGEGRVAFEYEVTAGSPTPSMSADGSLGLTLKPTTSLDPPSILVHTAPSPQTAAILPDTLSISSPTPYLKTFALLLPTINLPDLPVYHRDPHAQLNSIATGFTSTTDSSPAGIVVQSTPEKLGLGYTKDESSDEEVRAVLFKVLRESQLLPAEVVEEAEKLTGRESQVKRWKFAQVEQAAVHPPGLPEKDAIKVLADGKVILAGDGTAGGAGGLVGAWTAGVKAAEVIRAWVQQQSKL